jgi:hypothetical protein
MPLPRKKDDGTGGAPVLDIMSAHVRLIDVEEHTAPYSVTRKSDGTQFELDPGFKCTVEIVADGEDGADNGTKFFESFKYKLDKSGEWLNKENSKLGQLTGVVKPGYYADPAIPDLTAEDLEGFEMRCRIKPKKNPQTGQVLGSTVDWETMRRLPETGRPAATPIPSGDPSFAGGYVEGEDMPDPVEY